jgi:predicted SnoaL-like aldol condensation-catalyzing enzyme
MIDLTHILSMTALAFAALPVMVSKDQEKLLKSGDPKLAANKKLVYDFYRIVLRARRLELAEQYMKEDYMQHNPNAETGIKGFKDFFSKLPGPPPPQLDTLPDLVAIQAEDDYVTLSFIREHDDPSKPGQKYSTTWFDMFRIEGGKIAEHWDPATKPVAK